MLSHKERIGCSGWQYARWRVDFYPCDLRTTHWFAQYALSFDTVEINNTFLRALPRGQRHAVEFREPGWYDDRVLDLLDEHGVAAVCLHDMQGVATGRRVVGPFINVRFHFGTKKHGGR